MCLNPGEILAGRYRIIARLGQGGFARTYTAQDIQNPENPPCVVKEIPFPSSENPRSWRREGSDLKPKLALCSRLGKTRAFPNYSIALKKMNFYLVQEYVEGIRSVKNSLRAIGGMRNKLLPFCGKFWKY
jgi:serine/threonine protein kinase